MSYSFNKHVKIMLLLTFAFATDYGKQETIKSAFQKPNQQTETPD